MANTNKAFRSVGLVVAILLAVAGGQASAASLTWDTAPGDGAVITDGTGNWSNGGGNWNNGGDTTWNNATPDQAIFGGGTLGAAGTVTLTSAITAGGITFNTPNGGGNYVVTGNTLTLANGAPIVVNAAGTSQINSAVVVPANGNNVLVSGAGNLMLGGQVGNGTQIQVVMNGTGTLTLGDNVTVVDNNNLGLTVNSGTVLLNKANSGSGHAAGNNVVVNGGLLKITGTGGDQIYDGNNGMTIAGGTFDLNGANEAINALNGAGGLVLNNGSGTSTITLGAGGAGGSWSGQFIDNNNGGGGVLALVKGGGGVQTIAGTSNTYTGKTTITGGRIYATADGSLGAVPGAFQADNITLNGGSLQNNNSDLTLNANRGITLGASGGGFQAGWSKTLTVNGVISGAGVLTIQSDSGTVYLNNANSTFTGGVNINGIVSLAALADTGTNSSLGASGDVNFTGGTLQYTGGSGSSNRRYVMNGAGGTLQETNGAANLNLTGIVRNGTLNKTGPGMLTLSGTGDNDSLRLNATGGTTVLTKTNSASAHAVAGISGIGAGATVQLAGTGNDQIYDGGGFGVTMSGGTFDFNGRNEGFDTLNGTGTVTNTALGTAGVMTVGTSNSGSTFSGVIQDGAGTMALVKTGSGVFTLAGTSNTYSGKTTINGGFIYTTADSSLGAVPGAFQADNITLNGGGTLQNSNSDLVINANRGITLASGGGGLQAGWNKTLTVNSAITGPGALTIRADGGTVYLAGTTANTFTGMTTVNAITLALNKTAGVDAIATGGATVAGGTLKLLASNQINDGGAVIVNSGTFDLAGQNETIHYLAGSGGTVSNSGAGLSVLTMNLLASGGQTYSGQVNGNIRLVVSNANTKNTDTQALTGTNGYTGGTVIDNGQLRLQNDAAVGAVPGSFDPQNITIKNGGVLQNNNSTVVLNANRGIFLAGGDAVFFTGWGQDVTVNGAISGTGRLGKSDGARLVLNAANTFTGDTVFNNSWGVGTGTILLGNALALQNSTFDATGIGGNGTLDLNGLSATLGGLKGAGATLSNFTGTLSVGNNNQNNTFSGTLNGTGTFVKIGTGIQTLSGTTIDHTGATNVQTGRLILNDVDDLLGTGCDIATGSVLEINAATRKFQFVRNGTISGGGTLVKTGANEAWIGANGIMVNVSMAAGSLIDVQQGVLRNEYSGANWTANQASLNVASGATFYLWDANTTVDALTGLGTVDKGQNNTHTLTIGSANGSGTFSGTLRNATGTINLTKVGSGTETLSGAGITYTGATAVNAGRLVFQDATNFANGTVAQAFTIAGGATLEFAVSSGVQNFGSTGGLTISGNGTLVKSGAGTLWTGGPGRPVTMAMTGGLIDVQGGTFRNGGWQAYNWTNNKSSLNVAAGATFDVWDGQTVYVDALTGAGTIDKNEGNGGTVTLTMGVNNGSGTFSGTIKNTLTQVALVKNGSGNQTLSGPVSAGGGLTVNAGTLTLSGTDDNNSLRATVTGGTLYLAKTNSASAHAIGGGLTISGGLAQITGTGGDQIYDGTFVNLTGGTFDLNGNNEQVAYLIGGSGSVTNNAVGTTSTLTINTAGNEYQFGATVNDGAGIVALVKNGTSNQHLDSTANTYSGKTTVLGGVLQVFGDGSLGAVPGAFQADNITLNGGTLKNDNSTLVLNANRGITLGASGGGLMAGWSQNLTVNGVISGPGALTIQADSGIVYLNNANSTFTGGVNINGTVSVAALADTGTNSPLGASGDVNFNGGTLQYTGGSGSSNRRYVINGSGTLQETNGAANLNLTGIVRNGTLNKTGPGMLTLSGTGDNDSLRLNATGGTTVLTKTSTGGVHAVAGISGIGAGATVQLAGTGNDQIYDGGGFGVNITGGTLDFNGTSEGFDTLSGNGTVTNTAVGTTSVMTVGTGGGSGAYSGVIQDGAGTMVLVKTGGGVLTLAGTSNTYSGKTTINGGFIYAAADSSLGALPGAFQADNITLNNVGTLQNSDSDTVINANRGITLGSTGGGLQAGWSKTLTINSVISGPGALTIRPDSGIVYLNANNTFTGGVNINGTVSVASVANTGTNSPLGPSGDVNFNGGTLQYTGGSGSSDRRYVMNGVGGTLQETNAAANLNLTGIVRNGVLNTTGPGTLTLTGAGDNDSLRLNALAGTTVLAKASTGGVHAVAGISGIGAGATVQLAGTGGDQIYFGAGFGVTMSGGTFDFNGRSEGFDALRGTGTVTNTAPSTTSVMTVGQANSSSSFGGVIQDGAGKMALTKVGSGTLTLSNNNLYTGATTISQGTVRLAPVGGEALWLDAADASSLVQSGGTVSQWNDKSSNGRNATQGTAANQPQYIASNAAFQNKSVLRFAGNQVLNVDLSFLQNNAYTIFAVEGKLAAANVYFLGTNSGSTNTGLHMGYRSDTDFTLAQYANDLDWTAAPSFTGVQVARVWTGELDTTTGHSIYLSGALEASNANTAPFSSVPANNGFIGQGFQAHNPYQGDLGEIIIFGSALSAADRQKVESYLDYKWYGIGTPTFGDILPPTSPVQIAGGATLDLNGINQTVGSLADSGGTGGSVLLGGATLTTGNDGTNTSFSGVISGNGGLTKIGGGTFTLAGANTYVGPTIVNAGRLLVNGSIGTGANPTAVTVTGGMLGGNGTINGPVTVAPAGTISAGDSPGHLTINGAFNLAGTMLAELGGTTQGQTYDWIEVNGVATLSPGSIVDVNAWNNWPSPGEGIPYYVLTATGGINPSSLAGVTFDFSGVPVGPGDWKASIVPWPAGGSNAQALMLEAVPEPATMALLGVAIAGLGGYLRRRRNGTTI